MLKLNTIYYTLDTITVVGTLLHLLWINSMRNVPEITFVITDVT